MKFLRTPLEGAFVISLEPILDERGSFMRTFDRTQFRENGLNPTVAQCNVSFNAKSGTLRGMHYQVEPHGECKIVRCTRGAIYDVIVDLRPESATYRRWFSVELRADPTVTLKMLYVPVGMAHGFQTLQPETEIFYQMSHEYVPESARGVRYDDAALGIAWPATQTRTISDRDRGYPDFIP